MVLCIEERRRRSGGFAIATEAERGRRESTFTQDWQEAQWLLRERLRLRCRAMTQSANASVMRNSSFRSGAFSKRERVGCKPGPRRRRDPDRPATCGIGSDASRAASLASSYPKAMAMTRCVINSRNSCCTLPGCRSSLRPAANAEVRPNRRSAALRRMLRHRNCSAVDQTSRPPVDQRYLEKEDTLLWYVRSSEGLVFGLKPA